MWNILMKSALIIPLLAILSVSYPRHSGDYLNKVITKLQTPHIKWAKPYALGKVKVLFIVPRCIAPREIIELWQRFDVDFEAFTIAHSGLLSFESDPGAAPYDLAVEGTSIEEKSREIIEKLGKKYDAFVFANASFDVLPKEAQYKILKQVADGAGLLFVYGRYTKLPIFKRPIHEQREFIFSGVPFLGLDFFKEPQFLKALKVNKADELPSKLVETFRFGKGRIAVIQYGVGSSTYYGGHGLTPPERYSPNWHANYEYYLSLVFKSLLWTIPNKLPKISFTSLPKDGFEIDRSRLPQKLEIILQNLYGRGLKANLLAIIRDKTNKVEFSRVFPISLNSGKNALSIELPRLKCGGHFLDFIVTSPSGTENWGSVYFEVNSSLKISEFSSEREFYENGEVLGVNAVLSEQPKSQANFIIKLIDTNGRVWKKMDLPIQANQKVVQFSLNLDCPITIASMVQGELIVKGEIVDEKSFYIFIARRKIEEFLSILWGGIGCANTGLGWMAYKQLRRAGFNAILAHPSGDGSMERVLALCDFPLVCYSYRIMGGADEKGWRKDHWIRDIEDGCFYNPQLQNKAKEIVLKRIAPAMPYGVLIYSLGDENYFDYNSGFSPIALEAFRQFLQKRYGSIDNLNRIWGTNYADWSQIELLPTDEAIKRGLWAMVHEHMSFNEAEYADYHHFLANAIKSADKFAKVGAEGSLSGDLELTIKGLEFWGPYEEKRTNELLRSIAPKSLVRGNWWGGYVGSHGARAGAVILWRQLLSGAVNSSLFFNAIQSEGLLATELSYAEYFEKMLPELREIYDGIGLLIAESEVPHDGIAIHWSQASEHSVRLFSNLGTPSQSQGNLLHLLDKCGFGYRYLTTRQIENGEINRGDCRILFLGCSQAISEREAKEMQKFVKNGGIVIADVAAGIMDGYCRKLWEKDQWSSKLDELFGIERKGEPFAKQVKGSISVSLKNMKLELNDFTFRLDSSVFSAKQAFASIDGSPILIANNYGSGMAIMLNFPFPHPDSPQSIEFMRALLAIFGIKPFCRLRNEKGYFFRRFRNGEVVLIGVVRESETASETELLLENPAFVYDVRLGKFLGKLSSIVIPKDGQKVRIFALLPSLTQKFSITALGKEHKLGNLVKVLVKIGDGIRMEKRIIRLKVFRPDNTEAAYYRSFLSINGEKSLGIIPLAFNDPKGKWKVVATDVVTGVSGSATFIVR